MVFSSILFLFLFLPAVLLAYYLLPAALHNPVLLISSIIFYSYGEPRFVFILLFSILVNYGFALLIDNTGGKKKRRFFLILSLVWNLGLIFVFKYLNFAASLAGSLLGRILPLPEIALPLGISFFTFQAVSYVADVYRGTVTAQKDPLVVALYIMFFPQLIAGPILRYNTVEKEILLNEKRKASLAEFGMGAERFFTGLLKKILIANQLSALAEAPLQAGSFDSLSPLYLFLCSIAFSLQLYFDFSGYSDMAIGMGRMFGFHFEENFHHPYMASSFTDFWRRWHISLSRFFRDYVYIPLGGNEEVRDDLYKDAVNGDPQVRRNVHPRGQRVLLHLRNIFVVWLLTGIWHGTGLNFIAWGMFYSLALALEKYLVRPGSRGRLFRSVWRIVTLFCVNLAWVLFHMPGLRAGMHCLKAMFSFGYAGPLISDALIAGLRESGVFLAAAVLFCVPLPEKWKEKQVFLPVYGMLFFWIVSFLILGGHNPFLYFNF